MNYCWLHSASHETESQKIYFGILCRQMWKVDFCLQKISENTPTDKSTVVAKARKKEKKRGQKMCQYLPPPHRACHACITVCLDEFPVQFFSFSSLKTVTFLCTQGMCYTLTFQATRFFFRHRRCENKCRYRAKIAVNTNIMRRTQWGENKKR